MRFVRQSRTCGALNRRFERDRFFQFSETVTGPAATHAGDNSSLGVRYGTYPAQKPPKWRAMFGFEVLWGKNAAKWASLSDMERSWLVVTDKFAVGLR